jgi:hypothetical protein
MWRVHQAVRRRGDIAIFNRSHYEDVLAARVRKLVPGAVWTTRYRAIHRFEEYLTEQNVLGRVPPPSKQGGAEAAARRASPKPDQTGEDLRRRLRRPSRLEPLQHTQRPVGRHWREQENGSVSSPSRGYWSKSSRLVACVFPGRPWTCLGSASNKEHRGPNRCERRRAVGSRPCAPKRRDHAHAGGGRRSCHKACDAAHIANTRSGAPSKPPGEVEDHVHSGGSHASSESRQAAPACHRCHLLGAGRHGVLE